MPGGYRVRVKKRTTMVKTPDTAQPILCASQWTPWGDQNEDWSITAVFSEGHFVIPEACGELSWSGRRGQSLLYILRKEKPRVAEEGWFSGFAAEYFWCKRWNGLCRVPYCAYTKKTSCHLRVIPLWVIQEMNMKFGPAESRPWHHFLKGGKAIQYLTHSVMSCQVADKVSLTPAQSEHYKSTIICDAT